MNCFALGIVADSPEAGELASLPRTMSGKPDGERSEPERPKKKKNLFYTKFSFSACS
jgi:hypothetical protein